MRLIAGCIIQLNCLAWYFFRDFILPKLASCALSTLRVSGWKPLYLGPNVTMKRLAVADVLWSYKCRGYLGTEIALGWLVRGDRLWPYRWRRPTTTMKCFSGSLYSLTNAEDIWGRKSFRYDQRPIVQNYLFCAIYATIVVRQQKHPPNNIKINKKRLFYRFGIIVFLL